jgi:hypothetical protein
MLDACDGKETILEASDVYTHIDPHFNYQGGASNQGKPTPETVVEVYEVAKVKDLLSVSQVVSSLCADPGSLCLTEHQILNFVRKHPQWLRIDGWATLFLFRYQGQFLFVLARASLEDLHSHVYPLEGADNILLADYSCWIVVSQLDLAT